MTILLYQIHEHQAHFMIERSFLSFFFKLNIIQALTFYLKFNQKFYQIFITYFDFSNEF